MPLRPSHLADRFGISVMPVREALRVLAAEDLVEISPRRGATVRGLSADDVEEAFAVRAALEALAARRAAANITDAHLLEMRRICAALRVACSERDLRSFVASDRAFHAHLYSLSGSPKLAQRIMDLWDSLRRVYFLSESTEQSHIEASMAAHEAIQEACESRDPHRISDACRSHTEEASARIVAALRASGSHDGRGLDHANPARRSLTTARRAREQLTS
jgi:DNA-binding GntR family transcriptional regulator